MRKSTPRGQPTAIPRVMKIKGEGGKEVPVFKYPHEVMNIASKDLLLETLDKFSHPAPFLKSGSTFMTRGASTMRYHVEWTLPTLRWYCRVYNVPVPRWLRDNHWADDMNDRDKKRLFGATEFQLKEWREDKRFEGVRG